jgi:spore germination cell wall hydrolase CwlJ-like protein
MSWLQFLRTRGSLLSGGVLAVLGTATLSVSALMQPAVAADSMPLPAGRAAALVQATSGDTAGNVSAIGDEAKLINAALPFSAAPVTAARAFILPAGESLDQRRALLCLTQAVYYEAGYEPLEGRRAVAQVVLNRSRHPAYPKSVCGVVYQHNSSPVCQFTFVCDGSLLRRPEAAAWKQAEQVARAALGGYVERSVGTATHYHADYVAPRWAPMLTKISKLGAHIFYRWPGSWGQPAAFSGRYIGEPRDPASLRPPINLARLVTEDGQPVAMAGPITDGTQLQRAPNDVGGLLDTSKGWTLSIPMPGETGSATQRIAKEQVAPPVPTQNDAAAQTRVIASR